MASTLGLQLNHSKSELICKDLTTREAMLCETLGLKVVCSDSADLWARPLGIWRVLESLSSVSLNNYGSWETDSASFTLMMPSFFFTRYVSS